MPITHLVEFSDGHELDKGFDYLITSIATRMDIGEDNSDIILEIKFPSDCVMPNFNKNEKHELKSPTETK